MIFKNERPILPALLTPFDENGKIDEDALGDLIDKLILDGADGFFACGSAAEVFLLSRKERKKLAEMIVDCVDERVPVILHVGSPSPIEAIKLGEHAAKLGVDALSAVPPFYYKYTKEEVRRFFFELADATGLKVLAYNIEMYTGVPLNLNTQEELIADERILGLKHTSANLTELNQIKRHYPEKLMLQGLEETLLGALAMGADGAIGATFNDTTALACQIRDLFLEGDMKNALEAQNKLCVFTEALGKVGVTRGIKYALSLKGYRAGECRDPYDPITEEGKQIIEEALEKMI